jgi:hypothetical protein
MRLLKLYGKFSIIILIFFSLQGEVVQRYIDLFQGKLQHRVCVPHKTAERQQLIKLQCFTQELQPIALPPDIRYDFQLPSEVEIKKTLPVPYDDEICFIEKIPSSLRGPPAFS